MKYWNGSPRRALRSRVQPLRPNTTEAVPLGNEIEDVPIRGPPGLIVPPAVRNGDPLGLQSHTRVSNRRYKDPRPARSDGVETNPAILWRKGRFIQGIGFMMRQCSPPP